MASTVFRKTPAGVAEVRERKAGLDARARTLLILCNGLLAPAALAEHLKHPVASLLTQLCQQGLLEPVPVPVPVPTRLAAAPAAPPAAAAPAAPAAAAVPDAHAALLQRAWQGLEPLFGPGTPERLQALQAARTPAQLRRALDDIRDSVVIYRGRKAAAGLLQRIERG